MRQNLTLGTRFKATGYYAGSNGIFGPSHAECPPQNRGTWDDMRFIGWGYMDAVGVTRNRSHAILSWTGQEGHEARYRVANEARAVYLTGKCVGTDVRSFVSPLRSTTANSPPSNCLPRILLAMLAMPSVRLALR